VRLTSPDKVLYPEQGITKRDLAEYAIAVADWMLPHVARRPITLVRCPTGRQKKCFYQRHAGSGVPSELSEVEISGFEESGAYLYITDVKGLVALVQMGVLEIHPWNARADRPERPDRVIFDLDPGEGLAFGDVVAGAHEVRARLSDLGLVSFAKTTGGKGLHVVTPLKVKGSKLGWDEAKGFAQAVCAHMANDSPDRYLIKMTKKLRTGRIFLDYLRNDRMSTAVAPLSPRARPGGPVSMPIKWPQVRAGLDPQRFTIETAPALLKKMNPWADYCNAEVPLEGAIRKLVRSSRET
jgi:bifunctional non-homologous end joining protein LigD